MTLVNFLITYDKFYLYRYFQLELLFWIGSSLYFFTKSISDPACRILRKEYIHFILVIIEFVYFRTEFYRIGLDYRMEAYKNGSPIIYQTEKIFIPLVYLIQEWLATVSIFVYIFLSLHLFMRYSRWLKTTYSNLNNKSLGWLRIPVFLYSGFWFVWIILRSLDTFIFQDALKDFYFLPSFIGISVITCWIGFKGYMKSQTDAVGFSKPTVKSETRPFNSEEA